MDTSDDASEVTRAVNKNTHMRNAKKIIAINTLIICIAAIALLMTSQVEKEEAPAQVRDGFCYWKTLQDGDAISETEAGIYQYQLYATTRGIEVWLPCGQK